MKGRLMRRLRLLGVMGACLLALAVAPRPARPAIPARPVDQGAGGPLSGKVILVDAGHGGTDGGARAKDSGTWEKNVNLQVAQALKAQLENSGAFVVMTRDGDTQYSENKRADLTARLDLARRHQADLILSVHMNEYRSRRESGPQVFYRAGQEKSRLLAGAIQAAMIRALRPARERAALAGDYFILSLDVPSVLVECGFLSNAAEEKLLLTPAYQERAAQAIREGVEEYYALLDALESPNTAPVNAADPVAGP